MPSATQHGIKHTPLPPCRVCKGCSNPGPHSTPILVSTRYLTSPPGLVFFFFWSTSPPISMHQSRALASNTGWQPEPSACWRSPGIVPSSARPIHTIKNALAHGALCFALGGPQARSFPSHPRDSRTLHTESCSDGLRRQGLSCESPTQLRRQIMSLWQT